MAVKQRLRQSAPVRLRCRRFAADNKFPCLYSDYRLIRGHGSQGAIGKAVRRHCVEALFNHTTKGEGFRETLRLCTHGMSTISCSIADWKSSTILGLIAKQPAKEIVPCTLSVLLYRCVPC